MHLVDSPSRAPAGLPAVELEIVRGRARRKVRPVESPVFLIGSAHDCDLVLADPAMPSVHTYLYVNPTGVSVRRLGEGPDLAVDGRIVQASAIANGQTLGIGSYEFIVRIGDAPPDAGNDDEAEQRHTIALAPLLEGREREGLSLVRALLNDIRASLGAETNLKLHAAPELPWKALTADETLLVRKAST